MSTLPGRKNVYTCQKCAAQFVTVNRDIGTTPFLTRCRVTSCNGFAQSSFYQVDQSLKPLYEWYRKRDSEIARENRAIREYHEMGGLFLRPIKHSKERSK